MRAFVSLWSADPLAVGEEIDVVDDVVDGYHIDVTDGHFVPQLLFGPDFVAAVRQRTRRTLDVHLMVARADEWIAPFADAGADMITVHDRSCTDTTSTLRRIDDLDVAPSLGLETDEPIDLAVRHLEHVERVLVMGTELGVKGVDVAPALYDRTTRVVSAAQRSRRRPEVFVDGGIRDHTVPRIAAAGADGVIPGSLVFSAADPVGAVRWVRGHGVAAT